MTHHQFISSYQNGALGCAVGTPQALALFFSGKVDRFKFMSVVRLLSVVSGGFIGACFLLFAFTPPVWAILGSITALAISCLMIAHGIALLVMKFAFLAGSFLGLALDRRALVVCQ